MLMRQNDGDSTPVQSVTQMPMPPLDFVEEDICAFFASSGTFYFLAVLINLTPT